MSQSLFHAVIIVEYCTLKVSNDSIVFNEQKAGAAYVLNGLIESNRALVNIFG